jgi:hypothetical protein
LIWFLKKLLKVQIEERDLKTNGEHIGQFSMYKNDSYGNTEYLPSDLIDSYYAYLVYPSNESQNFVLNIDGTVDSKQWNTCSRFPNVNEDILFHLSLPGCKGLAHFKM